MKICQKYIIYLKYTVNANFPLLLPMDKLPLMRTLKSTKEVQSNPYFVFSKIQLVLYFVFSKIQPIFVV